MKGDDAAISLLKKAGLGWRGLYLYLRKYASFWIFCQLRFSGQQLGMVSSLFEELILRSKESSYSRHQIHYQKEEIIKLIIIQGVQVLLISQVLTYGQSHVYEETDCYETSLTFQDAKSYLSFSYWGVYQVRSLLLFAVMNLELSVLDLITYFIIRVSHCVQLQHRKYQANHHPTIFSA